MQNNIDEIFRNAIKDDMIKEQKPQVEEKQPKVENVQPQAPKKVNPLTQAKNEVANAISEKNISDQILASFDKLAEQGQLTFPENYPLGNELKLAFYKLGSSGALKSCTKNSIANAISEMAIQGLQISKTQGYFIPYGTELTFQRSYFGDIVLAKRTGLVKDVFANVIHEGDTIEVGVDEYGRKCVTKFETKFGNEDNPIIGAFAVAVGQNDYKMYEIMTWKQIEANWSQSKTKNVQQKFPEEMAKRTAVRRLLKWVFNTSVVEANNEVSQIIGMYNTGMEHDYVNDDTKFDNVNSHNDYINASFNESEIVEDDL